MSINAFNSNSDLIIIRYSKDVFACGTAEVVEAFTDHNFIRDDILKGDTERYEKTKNTSRTIAMMGSAGLKQGTLVNDGLKPNISP